MSFHLQSLVITVVKPHDCGCSIVLMALQSLQILHNDH